jgi:hypothetical protein
MVLLRALGDLCTSETGIYHSVCLAQLQVLLCQASCQALLALGVARVAAAPDGPNVVGGALIIQGQGDPSAIINQTTPSGHEPVLLTDSQRVAADTTWPMVPGFIEPCLPSPADSPPTGSAWVHEIKHDGFRLMARRDPIGIRLLTRNGHD